MAAMVVVSGAVAVYIVWPLLVGRPNEGSGSPGAEGASMVDQLLIEKGATYSAIKELEFDHAMGNLSNQDYQELVSRYEAKAVALLRTIDEASVGGLQGAAVAPAVAGVRLGTRRGVPADEAVERQVTTLRQARGKARGEGRAVPIDEEIEQAVARLRGSGGPPHRSNGNSEEEIEQRVAALRAAKAGVTVPPATESPVAPMSPTRATCPACGSLLKGATAAFCSRCGAAVAAKCPACGTPAEQEDAFCSTCGASLASRQAAGSVPTMRGGADAQG